MELENDLAGARKAMGLSQLQLACLMGVTQGTVSRNETSDNPDRRYALAIEGLKARAAAGENLITAAAELATMPVEMRA